jgi:NADH:ubiquinone oxidoreductase subunit 3 (subunit A)
MNKFRLSSFTCLFLFLRGVTLVEFLMLEHLSALKEYRAKRQNKVKVSECVREGKDRMGFSYCYYVFILRWLMGDVSQVTLAFYLFMLPSPTSL